MITNEIKQFLKTGKRNQWFELRGMRVYLRHGFHSIKNAQLAAVANCIDLASVEVYNEGKGTFTKFLDKLEVLMDEIPDKSLYVENVLSERFANFFRRRPDYIECNAPDRCFLRKGAQATLNPPKHL